MSKKILMVAGPNGAGKTTLAFELLADQPKVYEFINADEIARGLAPLHPESMALTASKLMIKRLQELLEANKSFAFETTGAGTNFIKHLKLAKSKGYEIHQTFLWLANPKQAMKRVAQRVEQGGHHVPKEMIERRYYAGIKNFITGYLPLADATLIMDNSSELGSKKVIARKDSVSDEFTDWILRAHERSFQRAFETAVRTGTALIYMRKGKLVKIRPPYRYELVPIKKKKRKK